MAIPIVGELSLLIMAALIAFLAQPLLDARQCDGSVEAPQLADASRVLSTVGNALSVSVSAIASVTGGLVAATASFALMVVFSV